ncbi:MAG: hypothetical protein ACI87O_001495 [Planctomycetota bacterium]|jgi:hypothetical protein
MLKIVLSSSLLLFSVACASTSGSAPADAEQTQLTETKFLLPSPQLANDLKMNAERMPWLQTAGEQQAMIEWFSHAGEAAYGQLLELAADPRPKVANMAFAALAASRDQRLVEDLRLIPWADDQPMPVQYSRARAHLKLGDWSHIELLIIGLEDVVPYNRALCARILKGATKNNFGYDYRMGEMDRSVAVERWKQWYAERSADAILK